MTSQTYRQTLELSALLTPWIASSECPQVMVSHLELDSRKVSEGTTFVALIGHAVDGRKFIASAIEKGANAVIAQADSAQADRTQADRIKPHALIEHIAGIPVIYIENLDQHLSNIAGKLYQHPEMSVIGVTGTNGKTTITQLIAQWLELVGKHAAVMGTTGNGFLDNLQQAANTTGSAIEVQQELASLAEQQADVTAMEISSHGLVQHRVKDLAFKAGVFTNLSRDHLDYHGTMEEYANAKLTLFTKHACEHAIINIDDPVGAKWFSQLDSAIGVSLVPHHSNDAPCVWAKAIEYSDSGIAVRFAGHFGEGEFQAPLIGEFNASNLMLAMVTLLSLGVEKALLLETATQLKPVLGRMELFQAPQQAKVVVDYAHTPDALEKALQALRVHCQGKLWAIVGCGGDRDKGKRPMMAAIAERLGDKVILTDDNPRSESPQAIIEDMLAGIADRDACVVEHDRFAALSFALKYSHQQDIILLAGKGHEDYQIIKGETLHYSDRESAMTLLNITQQGASL